MELIPSERFKRTTKYVRAFIILAAIGLTILFVLLLSLLIYAKILGPPPWSCRSPLSIIVMMEM